MAFNRQFNPLPQSGPSYPSMAAPPGYPQRSSWYPNTTQNLPGTAWQPAPHHHYQQALPYTPDYPSRRGSYAMQSSSSGMASPSASMTPSMSWTTTSHYGRHGGSPSMSNDSFQNYANLSESSFQFFTPVRQGHFSMNATAPSFTPRFSGSISNDSVYGESNNPVLNPTHPGKQSSSANNASPLPRLHRTAPSISLSTSNRPSVTPIRSPLLSRGASPIGSSFSTGTTSTPLHNAFGLPLSKPRTYKVLLPLESDELTLADPRKRSLWSREPFDLDYEVPSSIEELTFPAGTRCKSPHPEDSCGPQELPDTLEVRRSPFYASNSTLTDVRLHRYTCPTIGPPYAKLCSKNVWPRLASRQAI